MKKSIIALALVVTMGLGFSAVSAFAWYCNGPGGGYGMRGWSDNSGTPANDADYKKFLDETAQLRKSIAVDRAVLDAILAGPQPDPKKVEELTGRIFDNQQSLAEIARSANIDGGPGSGPNPYCGNAGRGFGPRGECPGFGGRGVGPRE